ncbi:hypothetical protein I5677_14985 [Mobilitalea sibirica]|uniref:Uncharacterized protein n=1 Tax=Mobilitalea sibirica TaxID=1462919 RepID=A0A8J7L3B1_9FIRM|nr:hypothetical protein [Mobilitalea sibirica]MBH1942203.1 hypothetical protein [Mobilitalea sibirica]
MKGQFYRPGEENGFLYGSMNDTSKDPNNTSDKRNKIQKKDEDLIIEENTIYEIDRECYERLKRQKKRK